MLRPYGVIEIHFAASTSNLGMIRLLVGEFFHQAARNPIAPEAADGSKIILAANNRQPGDAVVEHGGGSDESGIVQGKIDGIPGQKFT